MGIGGHILGEKKLRQLRERTGLDLDRAYRRGIECEGRVVASGACQHYAIDWDTGEAVPIDTRLHWSTCPRPILPGGCGICGKPLSEVGTSRCYEAHGVTPPA